MGQLTRRDLIALLGAAAMTAFTTPHVANLNIDEQERVFNAAAAPARVDSAVLDHIDAVLLQTLRGNNVMGPAATLPTVIAQYEALSTMAASCRDGVRPRLLSTMSNASRIAGWICFNGNDHAGARRYYEQARTVAHEAHDIALTAMILANTAHLY